MMSTVNELFPIASARDDDNVKLAQVCLLSTEPTALPVDAGLMRVFVGGLDELFIVEADTLQQMTAFKKVLIDDALAQRKDIYVGDDAANFKLALRLVREGSVDPSFRRSRQAIHKHLTAAVVYGLPADHITNLMDRFAVLQNLVMPEIAALLETNPQRKLLLLKSVVRKARVMDIVSGGTQSVQSKIARIKVATNLIEACENFSTSLSETWKRKFLRAAEKSLLEGRSLDTLPATIVHQCEELQKRIANVKTHQLLHSDEMPQVLFPPKLARSVSESRRAHFEKKMQQRIVRMQPLSTRSERSVVDICCVVCSGQKQYFVHRTELRRFGVFDFPSEVDNIYVGDDPVRFELALHLVRCDGKLDEGEKADSSILKSYRRVAYAYGLEWSIVRKLEAWIGAHKNGVGGARNAREEIRALRLTRLMNPEKGDALVASAMAEAYMERVMKEHMPEAKRQKLLQKAEINLRTVLPILLTSMSVMQVNPEQKAAIDQSIGVLKQVLSMQGRSEEAKDLDAQVKLFSQGVQGAAKELSAMTRNVPADMYA